jgi:D-inositol-3-phosphate glycosyltransferase
VPQHELAGWYAAATLVAVPSYNESFGLVAAEAQAAGAPVVAAAVGGLTTVVRDGRSGLLVDTHEPHDWALALERVVADADFRDRLAAGALVQAREFSWEATAAQTVAVYERAHALMRREASRVG